MKRTRVLPVEAQFRRDGRQTQIVFSGAIGNMHRSDQLKHIPEENMKTRVATCCTSRCNTPRWIFRSRRTMQTYLTSYPACLIVLFQLCSLALATIPLRLPSLSLPDPFHNESTLDCSLSLPRPRINSTLAPPDPFTYHVPNSLITVTFYDYSKTIPEACVQICFTKATRETSMHMRDIKAAIGRHLQYNSLHVSLSLNPWSLMTWSMWNATIEGLRHFLAIAESVGFDFDVEYGDPSVKEPYLVAVGRLGSL